jgi:uncharacterized protein YlbG (UPF0298 family)
MINETSAVVYAQLLTGRRYQVSQNGEVHLEKQWSKQVLPFVYQTVVKVRLHQVSVLSYVPCCTVCEKDCPIDTYS